VKTNPSYSSIANVMGMPLSRLTPADLLHAFEDAIVAWRQDAIPRSPLTVAYANASSCNLFVENPTYRDAILATSLVYVDGNGPRIAAWFAGDHLPPRMTAPDWFDAFCDFCTQRDFSLFLLGAKEGVAARATDVLLARHPSLRIVGHHHGYFEAALARDVIDAVNDAHPDILVLAMGSPYQEHWMISHQDELSVPVIWGSGGAIDYISGSSPRPPLWMRRLGLEWFGRLLNEPRRLWRRYIIGIPKFGVRAIRYAVRARLAKPSI
jgi:N-acetylglucosaminyldiphosphoundecaprenol N-acetyl-beta-D-mannosaminyltransferase